MAVVECNQTWSGCVVAAPDGHLFWLHLDNLCVTSSWIHLYDHLCHLVVILLFSVIYTHDIYCTSVCPVKAILLFFYPRFLTVFRGLGIVSCEGLRPLHTHLRPKNTYRRRPDFYVSFVDVKAYEHTANTSVDEWQ